LTDILTSATEIFNPFVPVIALVLGVSLALKMISRVARMW
jgi:hypothetical protein